MKPIIIVWYSWRVMRVFFHMLNNRILAVPLLVFLCLNSYGQAQTSSKEQESTAIDKFIERIENLKHRDVYYILDEQEQQITDEKTIENMERVHLVLEYSFQSERNEKLKKYAVELERIARAVKNPSHVRLAKVYQVVSRGLDGNFTRAVADLEVLLAEAREAQDVLVVITAYNILATLMIFQEEFNTALEYANRATKLLPEAPERNLLELQHYNTLAFIYTYMDDMDRTIEFYNLSLNTVEESGLAIDIGIVLYNVASSLQESRRFAESEQFLEAMIELYRQTNQSQNLLFPYEGLARIYFEQDDYEKSMEYIRQASKYTATSLTFELSLNQLGAVVAARLGQLDKARQYRQKIRKFFKEHPDHIGTGWPDMTIRIDAEIARAENQPVKALEFFEQYHKASLREIRKTHNSDVMKLRTSLETNMRVQKAEQDLIQKGSEIQLQRQRMVIFASLVIALVILVAFVLQRRVAQQLIASKANAESANMAKSDFLANMSHELRTPLNAIIGFSDMMMHQIYGKLGSSFYEQYAEMINSSGHHLLNIINEILDISKVESGNFELNESDCNVESMVAQAIKLIKVKTSDKNKTITITQDVSPDLPELYADPQLVNQILYNALSNAVKFSVPGGLVRVKAFVGPKDHAISIQVSDDGIGMTRKEIDHVLKPFAQVKNSMTRSQKGTGLGLPLIQAFMGLHNGSMNIESKKGCGTTVNLIFPSDRTVA